MPGHDYAAALFPIIGQSRKYLTRKKHFSGLCQILEKNNKNDHKLFRFWQIRAGAGEQSAPQLFTEPENQLQISGVKTTIH